jgi:hypothetical protein
VPKSSAFLRSRIGDEAVTLTALMILGKIFRDGHAVLADKQEAMAIFVDLHFVAGAHPAPQLGFSLFVRSRDCIVVTTQFTSEIVSFTIHNFRKKVIDP